MTPRCGFFMFTRSSSLLAILMSLLFLSGCKYDYTGPGFDTIKENPKVAPWFNVYRPADMTEAISATGHLLPVVVWANGGCLRSDFTWQPLFKRWAAEGYVVLALAEAPIGGPLGISSAANQGALIDWVINQSPYSDMVDTNRIVAAGNSCGGVTSLQLAARDPRVSAVFVLSGSSALGSTSKKVMEGVSVPVGYVIGGSTDIAGANARRDYELLAEGIPAMIVNRGIGGHITVSTTVDILEQVADISFHWLDLVLYGSPASFDELNSQDVCSDCTPGDWTMVSKNLDSLIE